MQNQNLTDDDILELVNILQKAPEIKELDVTNNQIRNRGAQILANKSTVSKLRFYKGNPLTIESLRPFLQNKMLIEFPIQGGSGILLTEIRDHINANNTKSIAPVFLIPPITNDSVQLQPTIPNGNLKPVEGISVNKQILQSTANVNHAITNTLPMMPTINHTLCTSK